MDTEDSIRDLIMIGLSGWMLSYFAQALGNRPIASAMRLAAVSSVIGSAVTIVVAVGAGVKHIYDRVDILTNLDGGNTAWFMKLYHFIDNFPI